MHAIDRFRLDGRVALITGGARGLGYVIADALASAGADVALTARDPAAAAEAAQRIADNHAGRTLPLSADVTRADQVESLVADTIKTLGRLDILVNNAGINLRGPIETLSESDWDAVLDTNLKGPWLCCRAVASHLKAQKWGRVINVSSMLGEISLADRTALRIQQGGPHPADPHPGPRMGPARHLRQRPLSRPLRHRDQHPPPE